MGGLPRPDLSPGPQRELVLALHQLHHRAGWPSLRKLAAVVGVSPTTVSGIFSTARLPTWGALELLVEALHGDVGEFEELWFAAGSQSGAVLPAVMAGPSPSWPSYAGICVARVCCSSPVRPASASADWSRSQRRLSPSPW